MFNRRRLLPAATAMACLIVASGASADPINTFAAAVAPPHVKPASSAPYTVALTNDPASPEAADRAKVGIPAGFVVDGGNLQATTSTAGACQASRWVADGELISDGKINLKRPEASPSDELCPGATLTVTFTAMAASTEGPAVWASELLRGAAPFALAGSQPTVQVDGTAPQVSITSAPSTLSTQGSASFDFTVGEPASFECKLDDGAFESCSSPKSYGGLADGSHTFVVKATDAAGNDGQSSHTWTIDTVAPIVTITDQPLSVSNDSSPTFEFTTNETANAECKLDGAGFAACSSPKAYAGLADGQHTFAVRAKDAAGNTGVAASYTWTSDLTPPTTTITAKPASPTNDSSPSFTFSAGEAAQFQCRLDGAAFAPCSSPKSYTSLGDGSHAFDVRATDAAGNTGPDAHHVWTIDTIAPAVTITGAPSSPTNGNSPSFAFTADGPATFRCKLNAGAFETCSSPKAYSGLPDGPHTFEVEATDAAGNTSAGAAHAWTIDTDLPAATITEKPAASSSNSSPSFSFDADEGGSSFQCKLDTGAFSPCTSPKALSGLIDGSHTFSVRAADPAGNVSPIATYTWVVDTGAPVATITIKPTNPSNVSGPALAFSAGETATFQCKLDGALFGACSSPTSYGGLADGSHTFVVKATDAAGNTGAEASYSWTIDTVAPTAAISAQPVDPSNNAAPSFQFGGDEAGASFACKLDGGAFAACSSPKAYAALTDATHTFRVKATDAAGNTGAEAVYTWRIDTVAPIATIGQKPPQLANTKLATFAFSANEAATLLCKLDGAAFASCSSPQLYPGLAEGSHTFAVKATDTAGNAGAEAAYTWTVDTVAPTTTITAKPADPSNTSFPSFSFGASESGTTYQCRLDGAAFAPCTSPKGYSNLAEVTHTFVVRATDAAGNTGPETSHEWTIDTTQPTASITSGPTNPSNEKSPTFLFASDENGTFSCKLDAGSFAPCTSPKNYGVNLADGAHTFVVRPTDLAGNVGASVSLGWTIDTTAPIASVTQRPANFTNDSTPTFGFTSVDATSFHCSLDGAAFVLCTSPTSYPSLPDGEHSFAVKATDSLGNTGLAAVVEWTIDTVPPTATITQKPASPSNDTAPAFRFSSSENGSTFACRLEEGGFAPCASPKSYAGLVDGGHKFTVRSTDAAGNTSPEVVYLWTVDTVAPATAIDLKPSALSKVPSPTFAFSAEPGSTFACKLDTGAVQACTSPKSYSNLVDGAHTFAVKATDGAGNTGVEASFTWTIDTVAPTAAIGGKPVSPTNDTTPTFTFSSEPGASFICTLDGDAAACSSPRSYPPLADGPHTFAVKATDGAGNTGADVVHTWTIDTQAPAVQITGKPTDPSNVKAPSLTFGAGEPATFVCKLDDASFAACSSPRNYTNLPDGVRTFSVRPTDSAGNTGAVVTYTWTIDTVAPTVGVTGKPSDFSNVKSPSFVFGAGETGATYQCRLDTAAFAGCSSPQGYSNLGDGAHTFRVRATDAAGNTGAETTHAWTIDTVVPVANITAKPSDPSKTQSPSFSFTSTEQGSFECRLDAEPFVACASPKVYAGVSDGPHTFVVKAIDRAGNPSAEKSYTWLLDATAPTTQIDTKPASPSNASSPSFTFSADQPSTFECKLDAEPAFTSCASPKTYAGLADGPHTFMVRAIDTAANTGVAKSHSWTIDTVAPVAAIADRPGSPSSNRSPSFSFTAADSNGYLCRLDGGAFAPCTSPLGYADLPDGNHVFAVVATDAAGNIGPDATHAWTIKTVAAGAAVTSAPPGLVNSSAATFTFAAGEPSSFDCQMDDRSFAPCSSPATYYGLGDGPHTFRVRPTDALGNLGAQAGYSWTIDTSAPETRVTFAPKSGTAATAATFRFSSSETGTFECRLDGAPFALCVSPKSYSGLRRAAHRFEVRAIDGAGNADGTPSLHGWTIGAAVVRTVSALSSPAAGARVTRPPQLRWRRVARARYYNVQVYRGSRKVLTAWPTRTRLQLAARWRYLGRTQSLVTGSYRWYVWPGYGAPSARRYGQLLGQSTFVVARRSGR